MNTMHTHQARRVRLLAAATASLLLVGVTACGSDEKKEASLNANKTAIVNFTIADAAAAGTTLDRDCLEKLIVQMSDDDADLLIASRTEGENDPAGLSDEAQALGEQIGTCVVENTSTTA